MPIKNPQIEQIRRAHVNAWPKSGNPAWLNCHNDLKKTLKYIEELESKQPAIGKSGFEPLGYTLNAPKPCFDVEHNPNTNIVIPAGMQYRHVCPGCGKEYVLRNEVVY